MWHEARRREKATQKLLNDHRKRAEKRREEGRIDPNSLLQVHGLKAKLHLDPNIHKQAAKSLVVWPGDKNVTIDRFDVRATLLSIPTEDTIDGKKFDKKDKAETSKQRNATVLDIDEGETMKKLLNFERYRLLMQNDLNKVTEETRLRLVAKSEYLTDARLRKLQNNRFGTSGETPKQNQTSLFAGKNVYRNQQARPKVVGVSTGSNYNQVPPPQQFSLDDGASDHQEKISDETQPKQTKTIIDLDDHDDFHIDVIDKSQHNSKRTNEIISKYGLSSHEFNLLAEKDNKNVGASDLAKELKRLKEKMERERSEEMSSRQRVYGPAVPPEMLTNNETLHLGSISRESSAHSSPVQQRSPSGADIPLRNGTHETNISCGTSCSASNVTIEETARRDRPSPTLLRSDTRTDKLLPQSSQKVNIFHLKSPAGNQSDSNNLIVASNSAPTQSLEACTTSLKSQVNEGDNKVESHESKNPTITRRSQRAATPLAYKRHGRSRRSISRDRRLSRRSPREYRHRSSRRRSRSRSSSSYSSRSSCDSNNSSRRSRGSDDDTRSLYRSSSRSSSTSESASSESQYDRGRKRSRTMSRSKYLSSPSPKRTPCRVSRRRSRRQRRRTEVRRSREYKERKRR